MPDGSADLFKPAQGGELTAPKLHTGPVILAEIRAVLAAHPGGLRRWSVMRAIRKERERTGQDVPQNFEAEVERIFRRFCADVTAKHSGGAAKDAIFFRPSEKAGEVWAILRDRASSWCNDELTEVI
jgi:hypothetical protein